jgi:hypothetical protein
MGEGFQKLYKYKAFVMRKRELGKLLDATQITKSLKPFSTKKTLQTKLQVLH